MVMMSGEENTVAVPLDKNSDASQTIEATLRILMSRFLRKHDGCSA